MLRILLLLPVSIPFMFLFSCSTNTSTADKDGPPENYAEISGHFKADWAMNKLWDDGLAEVAVYDAERTVYGKQRYFEFTLITVKEEFNQEFNVKTDDYSRPDLFTVMKVNQFCRIPTENYPYHYLTSVFIQREQPWALHKLTTSSQEWCGNTFKAITAKNDHFNQFYTSYFDGQGEGNRKLPKDILAEDQLPYTLRSLQFKDSLTFKVNVLETQQTNKAGEPVIYQDALVNSGKIMLNKESSWLVEVKLAADKTNRYWFAKAYPNQLLQQETWDGRNLKLKNISRYAYWQN